MICLSCDIFSSLTMSWARSAVSAGRFGAKRAICTVNCIGTLHQVQQCNVSVQLRVTVAGSVLNENGCRRSLSVPYLSALSAGPCAQDCLFDRGNNRVSGRLESIYDPVSLSLVTVGQASGPGIASSGRCREIAGVSNRYRLVSRVRQVNEAQRRPDAGQLSVSQLRYLVRSHIRDGRCLSRNPLSNARLHPGKVSLGPAELATVRSDAVMVELTHDIRVNLAGKAQVRGTFTGAVAGMLPAMS